MITEERSENKSVETSQEEAQNVEISDIVFSKMKGHSWLMSNGAFFQSLADLVDYLTLIIKGAYTCNLCDQQNPEKSENYMWEDFIIHMVKQHKYRLNTYSKMLYLAKPGTTKAIGPTYVKHIYWYRYTYTNKKSEQIPKLFKKLPKFIDFLIKTVKIYNFEEIMILVKACQDKQPDRTEKKDMIFKEKFEKQKYKEDWKKVDTLHRETYDYFKFLNKNQLFTIPEDIPITNKIIKENMLINVSQSNANTQLHSEAKGKSNDSEYGEIVDGEVNIERAKHVLDNTEIKGNDVDIDVEDLEDGDYSESQTGDCNNILSQLPKKMIYKKGSRKTLNTDEIKNRKKTFTKKYPNTPSETVISSQKSSVKQKNVFHKEINRQNIESTQFLANMSVSVSENISIYTEHTDPNQASLLEKRPDPPRREPSIESPINTRGMRTGASISPGAIHKPLERNQRREYRHNDYSRENHHHHQQSDRTNNFQNQRIRGSRSGYKHNDSRMYSQARNDNRGTPYQNKMYDRPRNPEPYHQQRSQHRYPQHDRYDDRRPQYNQSYQTSHRKSQYKPHRTKYEKDYYEDSQAYQPRKQLKQQHYGEVQGYSNRRPPQNQRYNRSRTHSPVPRYGDDIVTEHSISNHMNSQSPSPRQEIVAGNNQGSPVDNYKYMQSGPVINRRQPMRNNNLKHGNYHDVQRVNEHENDQNISNEKEEHVRRFEQEQFSEGSPVPQKKFYEIIGEKNSRSEYREEYDQEDIYSEFSHHKKLVQNTRYQSDVLYHKFKLSGGAFG